MNINSVIQVAVGLIFVWVSLALITSQVQEWIASILNWRASMLENAIGNILGNPELRKQFYEHPLVKGLHTNSGKRKPSGIPNDKFAMVLYEMVMEAGRKTEDIKSSLGSLKKDVENLKDKEGFEQIANSLNAVLVGIEWKADKPVDIQSSFDVLQKGVASLKGQKGFEQIAGSLSTLMIGIEERTDKTIDAVVESRKRIESWFDDSMVRLSGAYRRRVQIVTFIVGITLATVLNADSIAILNKLWREPMLREALVLQASNMELPAVGEQQSPVEAIPEYITQLNALSLPFGWAEENRPTTTSGWWQKVLGILLSGVAAAQGAPFWFDLMRKIVRPTPVK